MKKLSLLTFLLTAVFFSACKDDTFNIDGNYSEGQPATINMKITVPESKVIKPLSRSIDADFESRINELVLVGWEINSNRYEFVDLTSKISTQNISTMAGREYNLTENVPFPSGRYHLYLVANWSSEYGNLSDLESIKSEDDFKKIVFSNTEHRTELFGEHGFPMTQILTNDGADYYQINAGDNNLNGVLLERASAHIEFNITNGPVVNGLQPNFTPTSYTVYRIPDKTEGFSGQNNNVAIELFNSEAHAISEETTIGTLSFDFFMLENRPAKGDGIGTPTKFEEREAWDISRQFSTEFTDRVFSNAPAGATFVVIAGNYSGPAGQDSDGQYNTTSYHGPVSYIIHLGNFNTAKGGSWDNYNVNRNEYHKYNITVNGAHSIFANVEVQGSNQAVEGYLTADPVANVDAHYEKVMLSIPTVSIRTGSDVNKVTLATVRNNFAETEYNVSSLSNEDYKWIQFQKPTDANTFPTYAGIDLNTGECLKEKTAEGSWCLLPDLVDELKNYLETPEADRKDEQLIHATIDGDNFLVAAFIDENIYTDQADLAINSWAGFTIPNRSMSLNAQSIESSDDLQSTVSTGSSFTIIQKPIVSPYSLDPSVASAAGVTTYNPFGFEQVEEKTTARTDNTLTNKYYVNSDFYASSYQWDTDVADADHTTLNKANGYSMTIEYFSSSIPDVNTSFYKLTAVSGGSRQDYEFTPNNLYLVSHAIAMHNRDFNGNGTIDTDEIVWYIPTFTQYYMINFGYHQLPESVWMAKREIDNYTVPSDLKLANGNNASTDTAIPRYYSSGQHDQRLFWQDQRGAQSQYDNSLNWVPALNNIKFARNLGKTSEIANSEHADITRMTQVDTENHIVRIVNSRICRNYSWTEEYPCHTVYEEANLLPKALEYSTTVYSLSSSTPNFAYNNFTDKTDQEQHDALIAGAVSAYNTAHSTSYTELPDGWRVPNQRELIVLHINDLTNLNGNYFNGIIFSSTKLGTTYWKDRPYFLSILNQRYQLPNSYGGNSDYGYNSVILVRDVDTETGEPVALSNLRKKGIVRKR